MVFDWLWNFIVSYKEIIIFYLIIIILIRIFRKRLTFQSKFIVLLKTKLGLAFMEKIANKHRNMVKLLGYIGIGIGFTGMVIICFLLLKGLYSLIFVPEAPAVLTPVIPGVKIPGSPVFVPFWYGIIALFIVVVVHEFSHGVVARAHNLKIKSSGLVMFGPLFGAFVEPEEKQLTKAQDTKQYSVLAAGPFSNVLLAVVVGLIIVFIVAPIQGTMEYNAGVSFVDLDPGYGAEAAGLQPDVAYTFFDGKDVSSVEELSLMLQCKSPGEEIRIGNEKGTYTVMLNESPANPGKAYLGVLGATSAMKLKEENLSFLHTLLLVFRRLLEWVVVLSLGIGLANLLPLGPVDGGRMLLVSLTAAYGNKKGKFIWGKTSILCLIIIIILVLVPIIKGIF